MIEYQRKNHTSYKWLAIAWKKNEQQFMKFIKFPSQEIMRLFVTW